MFLYLSPSLLFLVHCIILIQSCEVNLEPTNLQAHQYNGSWFVVARKAADSSRFLPKFINSSMIKLQVDGENLNMIEYHSINGTCMPPLTGILKKQSSGGYLMEVKTLTGQLFSMQIGAIYHGYSGEQNEEMNMVLYGCQKTDRYGKCSADEELVMIMSNSRHPQTLQLFNAAKLIEDRACIDILRFRTLDTYNACGDDVVDEDQKLIHATFDENNEFLDVECRVENLKVNPNNISTFFDQPRIITVIAYIDPVLVDEQIAHISCVYTDKNQATCEWIRHNTCFKTQLIQEFEAPFNLNIGSNYTRINGTNTDIDWSGTVIWENGDEYISVKCLLIDDDGGCNSYRIYVWSDEDHMDQPTINEIYRQLQAICVDPTELVFLNTYHECQNITTPSDSIPCGIVNGWTPLTVPMLQGTWYVAADLNADPKLFLQSAIFRLTPNATDSNLLHIEYFAQKEADSECVGPGIGSAVLMDNSTLDISIHYKYTLVPKYKSVMRTLTVKSQVLYVDNQRLVLYWCFKRSSNGTCIQHDVDLLIRSRHFSHNDLSLVLPYLESVCIKKDNLRWFDLHSQCGSQIHSSTKLRRDLVTLSHYDVLHILTNVQEPRCLYGEVIGVKADFHALERGGPWFLVSRYDEMAMDTYAMAGRISAVSNSSAVLRLFQSAALPGEPLGCYTRVFTMFEWKNDTDYFYELHFESTTKNSTTMVFRFLFFNRHVGVLYSCLQYSPDGKCEERAIYVISRHDSIDHAELIVLETVAKSVCVNPQVLYHTAAHDECVYDHALLKPSACSSIDGSSSFAEWETLNEETIKASYGSIVYLSVASSNSSSLPFALQFNGTTFQKITDGPSGCIMTNVTIEWSARNRLLGRVDSEVVLFHPFGARSDVLLKEAQQTGILPCLHQIPTYSSSHCPLLRTPQCKTSGQLTNPEKLLGDWILFASDPIYVLNLRCSIKANDDYSYLVSCTHSESWAGECERSDSSVLTVDALSGFRMSQYGSDAPLRFPSEWPSYGNLSVSDTRLILMRDGNLVGRRYSVFLRVGTNYSKTIADELGEYCIWPLSPQIHTMEQNC